jgi:hypothetical protein
MRIVQPESLFHANFPQTRDFFKMEQPLGALAKQDPN